MSERERHSLIPDGKSGADVKPVELNANASLTPHGQLNGPDSRGNLTFEPGAKVGRYRLLAPIASGGMAQVWAARPEGFGFARTLALKLIRQEYAADEEYVRMFIDEATVAAAIQHPNVAQTYELGRQDGVLFMAMEWVAGDSLAGVLHRADGMEPLTYRMAARIVADCCAGLYAAHEATDAAGCLLNVVHRDVSPPNILLSLHGEVKVSDFGIAKARFQLHSKTKTGEIKGKFSYIAPEQIGGKQVDRRADIFALGCVLYVATLGLRPFGSGPRAMGKILTGDYKRPSSLVENYPPELEAVIEKCLQRFPDNRYSTADEMRNELERWLLTAGDPIGARDIANLVQSRMDQEKRRVTESLVRSNQVLADAVALQLMRNEDTQTPTATSSVMFGPAESGTRAPVPVSGRKSSARPAVRISPFASTTVGEPIQQGNDAKETVRPSRLGRPPTAGAGQDGATLRDVTQVSGSHSWAAPSSPSKGGMNAAARRDTGHKNHVTLLGQRPPYTWLAIGILAAAALIVALVLFSCNVSPARSDKSGIQAG